MEMNMEPMTEELYNQMAEDYEEIRQWTELDGYQDFAETTAIYPEDQALEYLTLGLCSEAGEVAGKIKKLLRDGTGDVQEIAHELGDVMWYVANLCSELEVFMSEIAEMNIQKLKDRQARGKLGGSGDQR
jgi:NTP pyrophosphatase (non-canonical NTP hydrolase)